jgi:GAG-pre-integrase domain/gag-polypeptide of LTR copia-type
MQSIVDRLRSIGTPVSDQDLVLYTLQGLGTEYENFVTALSMRYAPPTMVEFNGLLLAHEARSQTNLRSLTSNIVNLSMTGNSSHPQTGTTAQLVSLPSEQQVFYTTNQQFRSNSNRGRENYRGRGRDHSNTSNSAQGQQCQICEKNGHSTLNCYHRFDIRFTSPSASPPVHSQSSHQALLAEPASTPQSHWFLDSGATTHVTPDINNLSSSAPYTGSEAVHIGNGSGLNIANKGTTINHTGSTSLMLNNILHVPQITKNLLSVSQLLKDNKVIIKFSSDLCLIKDQKTHEILFHGTLHNGLYQLSLSSAASPNIHVLQAIVASPDLWHYRLAHCSSSIIETLRSSNYISIKHASFSTCSDCNKAKAHKQSFINSSSTASAPLEIVHSDLWGPSLVVYDKGNKYYVLFIDEFTRFT